MAVYVSRFAGGNGSQFLAMLKLLARFSWAKQNLKFIVSYRANVAFISLKS